MRNQAIQEAKQLVHSADFSVISTLSHNLRGYPFGSVSPFISDYEGNIYVYISDIAQHAKNLSHDSRVSFTLFNTSTEGDHNTQGRVTIVGDGEKLDAQSQATWLAKYFKLFPDAVKYQQTHDFHLWKISPVRIRFIGGFGKIFWIEKEEWLTRSPDWSLQDEQGMIEHMNDDHADAMQLILQHHGKIDDNDTTIAINDVTMAGVLPSGCYLRTGHRNHFIAFDALANTSKEVRMQLVALTQTARSALVVTD